MRNNFYIKSKNKIDLSFVSPVYNSEEIIENLVKKIIFNANQLKRSYEIILIDDYSFDNSYLELQKIKKKFNNTNIKIFRNKKNIGQHKTIFRLIKKSKGSKILIFDCDFVKELNFLNNFFKKKFNNSNVVIAKYSNKKKNIYSKIFWNILTFLLKRKFDTNLSNFLLIDHKTKKKLLKIPYNLFELLIVEIYILNIKKSFIKLPLKNDLIVSNYTPLKACFLALKNFYNYIFLRKI